MSGTREDRGSRAGRWIDGAPAALLAAALLAAGCTTADMEPPAPAVSDVAPVERLDALVAGVRSRLETDASGPQQAALDTFYRSRGYRPLWVGRQALSPRGRELVERLAGTRADALDSEAYRLDTVQSAVAQGDVDGLVTAELVLSRSLIAYSLDLRMHSDAIDPPGLLADAARSIDFTAYLDALVPSDPRYRRLRNALLQYRLMADLGGWDTVPPGPALRPGDIGPRVVALRRRLAATGDLPGWVDREAPVYDATVADAVSRFQTRHGLDPDGIAGNGSIEAMNVPAAVRIADLAHNLRALRGPEADFGDAAVVVNIAAAELVVIENGEEVLRSRTIVGQPGWETPRLASLIETIEINPTWTVPRRIAVEEIVPTARKRGFAYLHKRGFRLYDVRSRELDATAVDWTAVDYDYLPFVMRQDPGPANPLGDVKFLFDNEYSVYLHDTQARHLFDRATRTLSHGCVRVREADDLALLLLGREGWTAERYAQAVAGGRTTRVTLEKPVPVHLVTVTAWVGPDLEVQFRPDPYAPAVDLRMAAN